MDYHLPASEESENAGYFGTRLDPYKKQKAKYRSRQFRLSLFWKA